MDGDFRAEFVRSPGALKQHPALVLNADYRPTLLLSFVFVDLAGCGQGRLAGPGGHCGRIRRGGAQSEYRDPNTVCGGF